MCQAALQGGADISIVPKIMEYIETGEEDVLKYVSPCEKAEREIEEASEAYDKLREKLRKIEEERILLEEKYKKAKGDYESIGEDVRKFLSVVRDEVYNLKIDGGVSSFACKTQGVITQLMELEKPTTAVYVQVGEFLLLVEGVKVIDGKPVIKTIIEDRKNPRAVWRILPDGTLSCGEKFQTLLKEILDDLRVRSVNMITREHTWDWQ